MTSESVLARIAEFLETIWTHPAAAAQFLESPDTALGAHNLSQSDLVGVDLPSVAGGLAGSGGLSPEGRQVLVNFASGPSPHHGGPVQHIGHVTHAVHHSNPTVQKIFVDNSQTFNIDNSTHFVNNGTIGGDVVFDNDANVATNGGVIVNGAGGDVAVGTTGAVVNTGDGDVIQAKDSAVLTGGSGGKGDEGRDRAPEGKDDDHGDDDHGDDHDDDGGKHHGDPAPVDDDLSFGHGDSDGHDHDQHHHQDDQQERDGQHGRHGDQHQDADGQDGQQDGTDDHDPGLDPTAAAPDPTLVEGHDDQHDSVTQPQVHGDEGVDGHDTHHDPHAGDLVDV